MRSILSHQKRGGKRTSRGKFLLSVEERRRLLQLGISLGVFVLALLGRSAFPGQMETWSDFLVKDIDLEAALTRFEESTAQGEPFLDALGELCMEVFTAEEGVPEDGDAPGEVGGGREEYLFEKQLEPVERYRIWNEFREGQWRSE